MYLAALLLFSFCCVAPFYGSKSAEHILTKFFLFNFPFQGSTLTFASPNKKGLKTQIHG